MKTLSKLRLFKHRVPIKLQLNAVECGAACLAMILSYYGRETNVAECYELIDIGRDGLTAKSIANLARSYGLRVKAYSLEPSDFKYVQLPAIAHWDFNHFVVVENWSPKKVKIVILVLQEGRIVEQGNHEQLLAQQGYYAHLVQSKIKLTA